MASFGNQRYPELSHYILSGSALDDALAGRLEKSLPLKRIPKRYMSFFKEIFGFEDPQIILNMHPYCARTLERYRNRLPSDDYLLTRDILALYALNRWSKLHFQPILKTAGVSFSSKHPLTKKQRSKLEKLVSSLPLNDRLYLHKMLSLIGSFEGHSMIR